MSKNENNIEKEDEYFVKRVAHFIKSKRNKMEMTQAEMGDLFNLNIHQISRMEAGDQTTKLSTSLRVVSEFAKRNNMSAVEFISYMLQTPIKTDAASISPNELSLLKAFRKVPAELRRKYAELAEVSSVKFSLALEIQTLSAPVIKKILDLVNAIREK